MIQAVSPQSGRFEPVRTRPVYPASAEPVMMQPRAMILWKIESAGRSVGESVSDPSSLADFRLPTSDLVSAREAITARTTKMTKAMMIQIPSEMAE